MRFLLFLALSCSAVPALAETGWDGLYATTGSYGYDFASSVYDISSYSLSSYEYTTTTYDTYTYDYSYSYPSIDTSIYTSYDPYSSYNYFPDYNWNTPIMPSPLVMPYLPTVPGPINYNPVQPVIPYPVLTDNPYYNYPPSQPNRWTVPRTTYVTPYNPVIPPSTTINNPITPPTVYNPPTVGPIDRPTVTPTPIFTTPTTPTTPTTFNPSPSYQYNSGDPVRYQVPRASH